MLHPWFTVDAAWHFEAPLPGSWRFDETDKHNFHGMLLVACLCPDALLYVQGSLLNQFVTHVFEHCTLPANLPYQYTLMRQSPMHIWQRIFALHTCQMMNTLRETFHLSLFRPIMLETCEVHVIAAALDLKNTAIFRETLWPDIQSLLRLVSTGLTTLAYYLEYPWIPKVAPRTDRAGYTQADKTLMDKIAREIHPTSKFIRQKSKI